MSDDKPQTFAQRRATMDEFFETNHYDVEMPLKPGPVPKQPAATTRAMNTAFKQAAETSSRAAAKRSPAKASASNGTSGKRRKGGKK